MIVNPLLPFQSDTESICGLSYIYLFLYVEYSSVIGKELHVTMEAAKIKDLTSNVFRGDVIGTYCCSVYNYRSLPKKLLQFY